MKKLLLLLSVIIVSVALIFVLIPAEITLSRSAMFTTAGTATLRVLKDTANWDKWWPWPAGIEEGMVSGAREATVVEGVDIGGIYLKWSDNSEPQRVKLDVFPHGNDSTLVFWSASLRGGYNPVNRIKAYSLSRRLSNHMETLIHALAGYVKNPDNLYGLAPVLSRVTDTLLISTTATFARYPEIAEVYALIGELEKHIGRFNTKPSNAPMVHIRNADEGEGYYVQVALPVNNMVPQTEAYRIKRMIPGKLLIAEVQAGPLALQELFTAFEQYKNDYSFVSPAIPYQQLITNRIEVADTAQWITRFCYPVY